MNVHLKKRTCATMIALTQWVVTNADVNQDLNWHQIKSVVLVSFLIW